MHNPYFNTGPNLANAATRLILITPSDADPLPQVCKGLRIWNPNGAAKTVTLVTTKGDQVTITVPANLVWKEDVVVQQVMVTNTEATLIIHGYTD